jgi:hypothetical protein
VFDPVTAAFLRTAPAFPELDPQTLPQTLTARYAELVARRLRQVERGAAVETEPEGAWPLARIADASELVTSIHDDPNIRRAAAFVAGTAQQILAQESGATEVVETPPILHRDGVDPALAAALLFLAAEQYADANEAAQRIRIIEGRQVYVATLLAEDIQDLASGRLRSIIDRAGRRPEHFRAGGSLEDGALFALLESLIVGIELFAAEVLGESIPVHAAGYRDTLNIVMESGHRNVFDCERIFNELKGYFRLAEGDFLREFTVASKETCAPLMVADLLAATNSIMRTRLAEGTVNLAPLVANPPRKGAKVSFLELRPDALKGLKTGFERMRQRKIDLWREQRDAKRKASPSKGYQ